MTSIETDAHWWKPRREKTQVIPQNGPAIDAVTATYHIPKDDLFVPSPDDLIIRRVKKGVKGEERWHPGLTWTRESWLVFWFHNREFRGENLWDAWSLKNDGRFWEEAVSELNAMLNSGKLPVIFLTPKDGEYASWTDPAGFAVIRTSEETEGVWKLIKKHNTLRVIPLEVNDGHWEVCLDDPEKNQLAKESGLTALFRRFDVVAQRSSLETAKLQVRS